MRFADARVSRGLRPLTVTALCSVVAVLAVLLTQTVSPKGAMSGTPPAYQAGQGDSSATAPATDGGADSDSPSPDPGTTTATDAAVPAAAAVPADPGGPPPAAAPAAPAAAPPAPAPVPVPVPGRPEGAPSPSPSSSSVSYEAESSANTMPGTRVVTCSGCSGHRKVGDIGKGMGWLRFNGISSAGGGSAVLVIAYVNGGTGTRTAQLSVDGGTPVGLSFGRTADWSTTGWLAVRITLRAGTNTLLFTNPTGPAPDFDRVTVVT